MADSQAKLKRSKRLLKNENAVKKQVSIANVYGCQPEVPHSLEKRSWVNCGNPKCLFCMNPRKAFGEDTIQERRLKQDIEE